MIMMIMCVLITVREQLVKDVQKVQPSLEDLDLLREKRSVPLSLLRSLTGIGIYKIAQRQRESLEKRKKEREWEG